MVPVYQQDVSMVGRFSSRPDRMTPEFLPRSGGGSTFTLSLSGSGFWRQHCVLLFRLWKGLIECLFGGDKAMVKAGEEHDDWSGSGESDLIC